MALAWRQADSQVFRGYYPDGTLEYQTGQEERQNVIRGYYPKGALRFVAAYDRRGRLDGMTKEYYENGVLKAELEYRHDRRTGLARYYYASGMLKAKIRYRRDREVGTSQFYDEKGEVTTARSYRKRPFRELDSLVSEDEIRSKIPKR